MKSLKTSLMFLCMVALLKDIAACMHCSCYPFIINCVYCIVSVLTGLEHAVGRIVEVGSISRMPSSHSSYFIQLNLVSFVYLSRAHEC